jgi:hypothetical protein
MEFRTATVAVSEGIVTAFFRDGKRNTINLNWLDQPFYRDIARDHGYGDNWMLYGIEHELAHHFIADKLGWSYSWSIYQNPYQPWPDHVAWEEHLVNSFQRYCRLGERDKYGQLENIFGSRLNEYRDEFQKITLDL